MGATTKYDRRVSPAVAVVGAGSVARHVCVACDGDLGPASGAWKDHARRRELPLPVAGGPAYENGDATVVLRQFFCPACATLLETETAMVGDPVLTDRIAP
jgi:acetone carboxylase gamma subunit